MVRKTVFKGSVDYLQILDEKGNIDKTQDPKLKTDMLKSMFEWMLYTRAYDIKAVNLQRQGRMGTYGPVLGQEELGVGAALALKKQDWACPTYREGQVLLIQGVPLENIYLIWKGNEIGMKAFKENNCYPFAVPIASHLPQTVGIAYALKQKKKNAVMLSFVGDGGTSEGDFHEALTFAGVWKLPIVFLISNNGWAISYPRKKQTASATLAQKGLAYGLDCIQVDGNDVLAVHKAVKEAVEKARKENIPQVIEAVTYRMSMHTTADDPTKYRTEKELNEWKKKDPIDRFRIYLKKKKIWTKSFEEKINKQINKKIEDAVKKMESFKPDPRNMFRYVWEQETENLKEQMAEMERVYSIGDS
jgi:pyruvate dehydrogenase E1 component alpha subunit